MKSLGSRAGFVLFVGGCLSVAGCSDSDSGDADPGALIAATMSSQVGVLLDELPESVRERAADALLAEDDAAWLARARAQIALTSYRLVFRDFFYEEEEGKGQLPLPPGEVWSVELDGPARRERIGDHDYVLVDYRLETTLLTDVDSPGAAEPELSRVGGTWEEPFTLPVDPELLFQRTGYACMDESEFPPNSVDGENVSTFFDYECEAGESDCHVTDVPDESCLDALVRAVGSVETSIAFERLAWDDAAADGARVGEVTNTTGPDLEVIPEGLSNRRVIYRYIAEDSCALAEQCVTGTGWRRLLQFDASVKNVGAAALDIGDVDYYLEGNDTEVGDHNIYTFSECHEHYHFAHYGDFVFGTGAQESGNKQAFCLQSTNRYSNNEASPLTHPYGSCSFQGIQAGWGDDYGAGIECQWIDVTDLEPDAGEVAGELRFTANPDRFLCEGEAALDGDGKLTFEPSDFTTEAGEPVDRPVCEPMADWDANNSASEAVAFPATGGLILTDCARGQVGPLRDCGFVEGAGELVTADCAPGESVRLTCSVPAGAAPAVLRVCEFSQALATGVACVQRDSLENRVIEGEVVLDVACPAARDSVEVGGTVSLYSAPVLPGDELEITCVAE